MSIEFDYLNHIETPLFVLEVDGEGRPVYAAANDCACMAARCQKEDIVGKTAMDVYPGRPGRIAYERQVKAVRTRKKLTYELTIPTEGETRNVRTTLTPVLNDKGEILHLVGTSIDRTVPGNPQASDAAQGATASEVEDFITLAAHDLKAPMRNIRQLADMLRDDCNDHEDDKLKLIDLMDRVAANATNLMGDLLSHAQATTAIRCNETFDVGQLCSEIFVVLDPLNRHELAADPCRITTDKTAVQIALRNLFDNAIKHSGLDAVTLRVAIDTDAEGRIRISVRDNGAGFQDSTVAFMDGGRLDVDSGFGLLGVRRLIKARGGAVSAENLPGGQGSVVRFSIPGTFDAPAV